MTPDEYEILSKRCEEQYETWDPWQYVDADLEAVERERESYFSDIERVLIEVARDLTVNRPTSGFAVLQAVAWCIRNRVVIPTWLLFDMQGRFEMVSEFYVGSFDDPQAFGPLPPRLAPDGTLEHLTTARLRARWSRLLEHIFASRRLPRTAEGFAEAAKLTNLSPKQVRMFLPKIRRNTSARERQARERVTQPSTQAAPHDPFALAAMKRGKKPHS